MEEQKMANMPMSNVHSDEKPKYDPSFTSAVINAIGPKTNPRLRQLVAGLIQHVHDFVRENEVNMEEFLTAIDLAVTLNLLADDSANIKLNEAGRMSSPQRNEGLLVTDVLGLESLVNETTYKLASSAVNEPTATAILGPFYREHAPQIANGSSIARSEKPSIISDRILVHGLVTDFVTGNPIPGATVDVWHAGPNGLYDQQDAEQPDMNFRGRLTTAQDGAYSFYSLRPKPYPIPDDGPAGQILKALDRHPFRPAHIHFILTAPAYRPIVTQIFDRDSKYLSDDAAFAVKNSLLVEFLPLHDDPKAGFRLSYDFRMARYQDGEKERATTTSLRDGHVEDGEQE